MDSDYECVMENITPETELKSQTIEVEIPLDQIVLAAIETVNEMAREGAFTKTQAEALVNRIISYGIEKWNREHAH